METNQNHRKPRRNEGGELPGPKKKSPPPKKNPKVLCNHEAVGAPPSLATRHLGRKGKWNGTDLSLSVVCDLGSWLHSLLEGYKVNVSLAVSGRSNVLPHGFHVATASASSSPRALGPMTPLGLWHPSRRAFSKSQ